MVPFNLMPEGFTLPCTIMSVFHTISSLCIVAGFGSITWGATSFNELTTSIDSYHVYAKTTNKAKEQIAVPYVVLISEKSAKDPEWKKVADALAKKHEGKIITFKDNVYEALPTLKKDLPRFLALVGSPEEISRPLVTDLHRMTRQFDEDPYGDCIWGIVTGYSPGQAMRIVNQSEPLIIKRAAGTTNINAKRFDDSMVITDWQPFQYLEQHGATEPKIEFYKESLKEDAEAKGKSMGITPKLVEFWEKYQPELMVTSSHATQFNLEMPFGKGIIVSYDKKFYMLNMEQFKEFRTFLSGVIFNGKEDDLKKFLERIKAPTIKPNDKPAVWLAPGNCLIGDAKNSPNSMVITALGDYGFNQLVGYTVPSWYGEGGWGTLRLFFDNHDQSSLAEAWYLNNQFLLEWTQREYPKLMDVHFNSPDIHSASRNPEFGRKIAEAKYGNNKDTIGLVHDRDTVAFYGDPAWVAKLDESHTKSPWTIRWDDKQNPEKGFTIIANEDSKNRFAVWYPKKIKAKMAILSVGDTMIPVSEAGALTNDFLLIRELDLKKGQEAKVTFQ